MSCRCCGGRSGGRVCGLPIVSCWRRSARCCRGAGGRSWSSQRRCCAGIACGVPKLWSHPLIRPICRQNRGFRTHTLLAASASHLPLRSRRARLHSTALLRWQRALVRRWRQPPGRRTPAPPRRRAADSTTQARPNRPGTAMICSAPVLIYGRDREANAGGDRLEQARSRRIGMRSETLGLARLIGETEFPHPSGWW